MSNPIALASDGSVDLRRTHRRLIAGGCKIPQETLRRLAYSAWEAGRTAGRFDPDAHEKNPYHWDAFYKGTER